MGNLKAGSMAIVTRLNNVSKISNSVGNCSEKSSENEVTPCVDPVVQAAVGEAKEKLKKLEQDYQRTYKKFTEAQLNRYMCYIEGKGLKYHSQWAEWWIKCCKNLVNQLQNVLDRLNIEEASQRGTETPNHSKKFLMLHGCRSLAQEKMILQQKAEHKQPNYNDKLSKKSIDFKAINREFRQIQRGIPRISSKKHVHDLLSRLKKTNKLREIATDGGAMVGTNTTSQASIQNSTSIVIKLLAKVIKELEKEKGETDNILEDKRRMIKRYAEKMRHLQEKREWLCGKWDDARKYMLRLKNTDDGVEYFLPNSERWDTFLLPSFLLQ